MDGSAMSLILLSTILPLAFVATVGIGIAVGQLLHWHFGLLLRNRTSIEAIKEEQGDENMKEYSMGWRLNVMSVMG